MVRWFLVVHELKIMCLFLLNLFGVGTDKSIKVIQKPRQQK